MRVLHLVKTSDGALWAAHQAAVLRDCGVEVHVALPDLAGRTVPFWRDSGAVIHAVDVDIPIRHPWKIPRIVKNIRTLVADLKPDLIHSHFVGTTLILRRALGQHHPIPRVYQVAGPLHLENPFFRRLELNSAGESDWWIASSRCIRNHYLQTGVDSRRVFLSYYGMRFDDAALPGKSDLRRQIGATEQELLIGNVNWMYPPKYYLGQTVGVKAHEDLISAFGQVTKARDDVLGVIVGAAWNNATGYQEKLQRLARQTAGDRIRFTGQLDSIAAQQVWSELDLAVHVPISENCGGVIEPLAARTPVIASAVGGLPEIIIPGQTGWLVEPRNVSSLSKTILSALNHLDQAGELAARGQRLVRTMFDVERTAREVFAIYQCILENHPRPTEFDATKLICPADETVCCTP